MGTRTGQEAQVAEASCRPTGSRLCGSRGRGVALADQITPDGDIVTAGDQSTVNLETVTPARH